MVFESILNCKSRKKGILILWLLSCIFLSACDYAEYPYDISHRWVCTEPDFIIELFPHESAGFVDSSTINWENKMIMVDITFNPSSFFVLPRSSQRYDDRILGGTWKYRDEDLVLIIEEDYIFNWQFEELVFTIGQ